MFAFSNALLNTDSASECDSDEEDRPRWGSLGASVPGTRCALSTASVDLIFIFYIRETYSTSQTIKLESGLSPGLYLSKSQIANNLEMRSLYFFKYQELSCWAGIQEIYPIRSVATVQPGQEAFLLHPIAFWLCRLSRLGQQERV